VTVLREVERRGDPSVPATEHRDAHERAAYARSRAQSAIVNVLRTIRFP
jgi:hypothetical protein